VGVVYELAHRANMEPITIVNFEHLMSVLDEMRERGISSYLGCCCEPFFAKHREDMERAGVSGLIIGVEDTSCYELDQEREAKLGDFEGETTLKVDLLRKLFDEGVIGGTRTTPEPDGDIKVSKADRRPLYAAEKGLEEDP
jgi:lipoate-protein ligase A